ncbi:hypothetical protein GTID1_16180 [Geobacillus thermodenitrificans]|nr:hypothetical protein GD3902_15310 [Geobacillus thermodenitrificans]ATO38582.1 hypothetical protein GTID1_16180 [Geobacillus thermodenitrificans]
MLFAIYRARSVKAVPLDEPLFLMAFIPFASSLDCTPAASLVRLSPLAFVNRNIPCAPYGRLWETAHRALYGFIPFPSSTCKKLWKTAISNSI